MTKPWEQEWKVSSGTGWAVVDGDREQVCHCWTGSGTAEAADARTALIAAAPDMARALMALLPHPDEAGPNPPAHIRECLEWRLRHGLITECATGCQEVMDALRKAGVLP